MTDAADRDRKAILSMIESIASKGHAPRNGCSRFGVGYDSAFERIKRKYLEGRFKHGGSAEKFVVGPYGSGKTHFVRQLMELARRNECVTAEIALSKNVDFTQSLVVYKELTRGIVAPNTQGSGLSRLLDAVLEKIKGNAPKGVGDELCRAWVEGLQGVNWELEAFRRAVYRALRA